VLVPVGMGYAQAAGLPPITGLYATIVPLVVYAVFGPSRVMVLGPDSSLAAVIAAVILPLGGSDPDTAVALAGMLAILTGLVILIAGVVRLGFVTELLSRPVQLGYLYGIAITILVGQLPRLCGFSIEGRGLLTEVWDFVQGVAGGQVNRPALAIGLGGILVILGLRRVWPLLPGVMVAVGLGIAAVAAFDLTDQGVKVIGVLPEGLPKFALPAVELNDVAALFSGALGIALVAVADTTVLSQSLAAQRDEVVDPNQELVALGAANLASGLFQGFAISSSASRTPVAVAAGARSQLTPLVGAATIALLLVSAPGALRNLPLPMLAAVVITAAIGLIDVAAVRRLYQVRRSEFVLWLAAFLGVALLGVLLGIFVAILLSLADFVRRAWRPHDAVLGREDELKGYHDIDRHPERPQHPGPAPVPVRRPALLRQRRLLPSPGPPPGRRSQPPRPLGRGRRRTHDRRGYHRRRHSVPASRRATAAGHHPRLRRDERPRQGPPRALRPVRRCRSRPLLSHHRHRRRRLHRSHRRAVDRLGRTLRRARPGC
jgi:high affinity sulfate transporter 1